ncbi:chemotaxis protein CheB [Mucilaginibacter sp. CAU 1740]|uniref:chemotaxis protein CheB n=1 Tax=Mucilaginibacter sp. CAU 1740 TaxID=3140365 RepID=UPI00325BD578
MAPDKNLLERWRAAEILLFGGSAGSFKILFRIVKDLSETFGKAVILVIHRKKNFFSEIEKLFAENSRMYMREIEDKDILKKNTMYIAPANYHTLIEEGGYFSLDVSEAVWYSKPSIDVTFESAAEVYGSKCVAILLSGANQDGANGMLKIRESGGLTIAQAPEDAEMPEMPRSAINNGGAEYVLTQDEIFKLLLS